VLGFNRMLAEINDIAGQHETVAETLNNLVILTLQSSIHDIKQERKKVSLRYICCDPKSKVFLTFCNSCILRHSVAFHISKCFMFSSEVRPVFCMLPNLIFFA